MPTDVQTIRASDLSEDPGGLIYEPGWALNDLMDEELKPLFPEFGFWNCNRGIFAAPAGVKEAAFYVAATSTSTEPSEGSAASVISLNKQQLPYQNRGCLARAMAFYLRQLLSVRRPQQVLIVRPLTDGPNSRFPLSVNLADAAAPFARPQDSPVVKTASTIAPPARVFTANASSSQGPFEPYVTELPLVLIQPGDIQGPQAATTIPKGESGSPTIPNILHNQARTTLQPLALGTQTTTPNSQHQCLLGSQTLALNQSITLASNRIATWLLQRPSSSLPHPNQASNRSNPNLTPIPTPIPSTPPSTTPPSPLSPFILNSQTISANSQNQYIMDGQTLTPGGVIVASGTTISIAPSATQLVFRTTTEEFGWFIMSGLGVGASPSGTGGRQRGGVWDRCGWWVRGAGAGAGAGMLREGIGEVEIYIEKSTSCYMFVYMTRLRVHRYHSISINSGYRSRILPFKIKEFASKYFLLRNYLYTNKEFYSWKILCMPIPNVSIVRCQ
ncbi:hypothetical protein N7G274_001977 [Stereocaulon virgatum]|uniref:Uncharacterized protein n=1 Tax=Stereocaulon virgatum TaxID=373712 RepID=A0ABR4AJ85_9LECA